MQPLTMPVSPRCPKQLFNSQNSPRQLMQVVDLKQCEVKWKNIIKGLEIELEYTQQKVKHLEQEYEELASIAQGYKEQINQLKQTIVQLTINKDQDIIRCSNLNNEHFFHIESSNTQLVQQLVSESKLQQETKQLINTIINENEYLRNCYCLTQSKVQELENRLQKQIYQEQNQKDKYLLNNKVNNKHKNSSPNIQQDLEYINKSGSKQQLRLQFIKS